MYVWHANDRSEKNFVRLTKINHRKKNSSSESGWQVAWKKCNHVRGTIGLIKSFITGSIFVRDCVRSGMCGLDRRKQVSCEACNVSTPQAHASSSHVMEHMHEGKRPLIWSRKKERKGKERGLLTRIRQARVRSALSDHLLAGKQTLSLFSPHLPAYGWQRRGEAV